MTRDEIALYILKTLYAAKDVKIDPPDINAGIRPAVDYAFAVAEEFLRRSVEKKPDPGMVTYEHYVGLGPSRGPIPCGRKMPPKMTSILLWATGRKKWVAGYLRNDGDWMIFGDRSTTAAEITHWFPYPEPIE